MGRSLLFTHGTVFSTVHLAAFQPFPLPVEPYLGHWKMSESDAVALVRKSIERPDTQPEIFSLTESRKSSSTSKSADMSCHATQSIG
jgi:hypothetical protein